MRKMYRRDKKKFLPKRFKKDINENHKCILLNETMLFDIRYTIFSLFKNGFIKPLEYQSAVKSKPKPKSEESIAEIRKFRRQRLEKFAKKKKMINLRLFRYYIKYSCLSNMYKELNKPETETN